MRYPRQEETVIPDLQDVSAGVEESNDMDYMSNNMDEQEMAIINEGENTVAAYEIKSSDRLKGIIETGGFNVNKFGEWMIVALIILVLLAGGFFLYKFFTKPAEEPQAEAEETGDTEALPLKLNETQQQDKRAEAEETAEQTSS